MTDHEKVREVIRLKDQAPLAVGPSKSALLVVDVQRYFSRPDYPFGQTFERLVPGSTAGYFKRVVAPVRGVADPLTYYGGSRRASLGRPG